MQLNKEMIDQIKNNEEKFIIVNETGQPQIVIMSYQAYQKLLKILQPKNQPKPSSNRLTPPKQLTSNELLAKINQEIAQWKGEENQNPIGLEEDLVVYNKKPSVWESVEDDRIYLETIIDE